MEGGMTYEIIAWLIPLAIGALFGFAWGTTRAARSTRPPHSLDDWKGGYAAGYDDAREQCLKVAKAHDYGTIERTISKMKPKP
jgi:hypothetical protein